MDGPYVAVQSAQSLHLIEDLCGWILAGRFFHELLIILLLNMHQWCTSSAVLRWGYLTSSPTSSTLVDQSSAFKYGVESAG